ncbi:unnamed protein product, partial [Rotaria sp. Silwood1]
HATDKVADLAAEYIEYQKKKMTESNIALIFGNLLLEMSENAKTARYFDTIGLKFVFNQIIQQRHLEYLVYEEIDEKYYAVSRIN